MSTARSIGKLSAHHLRAVPLIAAGLSTLIVAERLGTSREHVQRLKNNVEFQRLVAEYLSIATDDVLKAVQTLLTRDVAENVTFLQDVRRGKFARVPAESLRIRVQTSLGLLDRQIPKRTEVKQENTLTFKVSAEDRRALQGVMDEVKRLPAPAHTVIDVDALDDAVAS